MDSPFVDRLSDFEIGQYVWPGDVKAGAAASAGPKASSYRLRRQLLQLLLLLRLEWKNPPPHGRGGCR
jgi:hypothetical protein